MRPELALEVKRSKSPTRFQDLSQFVAQTHFFRDRPTAS